MNLLRHCGKEVPVLTRSAIPILLILVVLGCEDAGYHVGTGDEWAIYRLADTTLTSTKVWNNPLGSLQLESNPFITVRHIRYYHWTTHSIEGTPQLEALLDQITTTWGTVFGRPFVVVAQGERIYQGTFWWAYSSLMPQCPYIEIISRNPRRIELPSLHQGVDPRSDPRIYRALKNSGILLEQ
jgi:hypothetical protein